MSKGYYAVSVPVKTHIRKFIHTVEGEKMYWNSRSPICMMLRAFLFYRQSLLYSTDKYQQCVAVRPDSLKIYVSVKYKSSVGTTVHPSGVVLINQLLEDCFENALLSYVEQNTVKEGRYRGIKQALENFATRYNIELDDDITLSGLEKIYQRKHKKVEKNTTLVLSLHTPRLAKVS